MATAAIFRLVKSHSLRVSLTHFDPVSLMEVKNFVLALWESNYIPVPILSSAYVKSHTFQWLDLNSSASWGQNELS